MTLRPALALLLMLASLHAVAQYPSKPVRLIISTGAGTSPDMQGRAIGQKLSEAWGRPVVVENITGAGGNIGMERAAQAAPDGHTLLLASFGPLYINKTLYSKLAYDVESDFEAITQVSRSANILVVHPSVQAKSVQELVAYARANPGKLRFGSAGNGSSMHICAEMFKEQAGIEALHVPYKNSAQMAIDLAAGQFEFTFQNAALAVPYMRDGRLRALAVTAPSRVPYAPGVPAIGETGLSIFFDGGIGFLAPKGTPPAIVTKVYRDSAAILRTPAIEEQFRASAVEPVGSTPAEFRARIRSEIARWAPIIRASGARLD